MNDLQEKLNTLPFAALKELASKFGVKARSRTDIVAGLVAASVSENGVHVDVLAVLEAHGLVDAVPVEVLEDPAGKDLAIPYRTIAPKDPPVETPSEPEVLPEPAKPRETKLAEVKPKENRNSLGSRYGAKRYNRV